MRLVTWNMNKSKRRDAWDYLIQLQPDIAFVQEAIIPEGLEYEHRWTRAWPHLPWGSAVLSRVGALSLVWEDRTRGAVLVTVCEMRGMGSVSLSSIHARVINRRVIPPLRETFDEVRRHIGTRYIVAGDFNTSRAAARAWPKNGHGEFWRELETWGFHEPLPAGGERQTFWRDSLAGRPPTIGNSLQDDHVLMDAKSFEVVESCRVLDTPEVLKLSDHSPVVVDLALR